MAPDLWIYFLAVLAVILLPGMDMAFVMASSLAGGRRGAVSALLGIASGGAIHVIVGATGMAALSTGAPSPPVCSTPKLTHSCSPSFPRLCAATRAR